MTQWEYLLAGANGARDREAGTPAIIVASLQWQEKLNQLGRNGWELVSEHRGSNMQLPPFDESWFSGTLRRPIE